MIESVAADPTEADPEETFAATADLRRGDGLETLWTRAAARPPRRVRRRLLEGFEGFEGFEGGRRAAAVGADGEPRGGGRGAHAASPRRRRAPREPTRDAPRGGASRPARRGVEDLLRRGRPEPRARERSVASRRAPVGGGGEPTDGGGFGRRRRARRGGSRIRNGPRRTLAIALQSVRGHRGHRCGDGDGDDERGGLDDERGGLLVLDGRPNLRFVLVVLGVWPPPGLLVGVGFGDGAGVSREALRARLLRRAASRGYPRARPPAPRLRRRRVRGDAGVERRRVVREAPRFGRARPASPAPPRWRSSSTAPPPSPTASPRETTPARSSGA